MSFKELKVERIEGELAVALSEWYPSYKCGFVKIGQKKWFLPYDYVEEGDNIYNFEIRPNDTWIITYPRSGKLFLLFRFNVLFILFICHFLVSEKGNKKNCDILNLSYINIF